MCMWKFNDEKIIFYKNIHNFYLSQFSTAVHIKLSMIVHTLCNQLLVETLVYAFSSIHVCYIHIEDVHVEV